MKTITLSDEVHDKLVALAKEYFEQDNRMTAKPYLFQVREQVKVYDSGGNGNVRFWYDEDHNEYYTIEDLKESFDDIPNSEETEIGELYFWHDDWFDEKKLTLSSYSYEPRYSNAFFTSKGCDEHIRINGHNLYQPDNYLNHAYRNAEMDLMVEFFKELNDNNNIISDDMLDSYIYETMGGEFGVYYPDEHDSVMGYYPNREEARGALTIWFESNTSMVRK